MPRLCDNQVPAYRLHKQSGQAIVTLSGKDFLLGPYDSPASRAEYNRLIAEWLANGRQLGGEAARELTINELILAYWRFAKTYYRKSGRLTSEIDALQAALEPLQTLYGTALARDFRPLALQAVRQKMIEMGWARKSINNHIARIRRLFKWAVARELVPAEVHHGLLAVDGLRQGRSAARETDPVRPVPDAHVDAVIAALSPSLAKLMALQERIEALGPAAPEPLLAEAQKLAGQVPGESPVAAMIQIQRLSGMRSGELVILRGCDLDTSGTNWLYVPATHKCEHRERLRPIYLGPRAQQILRPFLQLDPSAYLFSPKAAAAARRQWMRRLRKSPVQPSQLDRGKARPRRSPGLRYDACAYRRAVDYACEKAGVPHWHPHQLRHNCATKLQNAFGIEAARVVLGHASIATTAIYAEVDRKAAAAVMAQVG